MPVRFCLALLGLVSNSFTEGSDRYSGRWPPVPRDWDLGFDA